MSGKSTVILIVAVILSASIAALSAGYVGLKVGPTYEKNGECCALPRFTNLFFSLKEFVGFLEFHSQVGQDRWIVHRVFPGVTNGYFVDVGSADGVQNSNTKVLEDLGWSGVCVDPFPTNMNNRTCTMFKDVVDSAAGRKVRFRAAGGLGGIENYLGAWKEYKDVKEAEVVELTTTTLEDILARAKAPNFIHYISLDIEGAELEALGGFPFSKYKVGAFTVEHNYEEPKRSQIKALLESQGYRRVRSVAQDDYYMLDQK
jgi:Methyltransferase FkbM domain